MAVPRDTRPYARRLTELRNQATTWRSVNREIASYCWPNRANWVDEGAEPNRGEKRQSLILNGCAERDLIILASGMQGGMTPASRPWFRLTVKNRSLAESAVVRGWLAQVEQELFSLFAHSNFYSTVHAVYGDQGAFGTGVLYVEPDPASGLRFEAITAGEYYLARGAVGRVDTLYRTFWRTAAQLADAFGLENCSDAVATALRNERPDQWIRVNHAVQPRRDRDHTLIDNANKPFESVYWQEGESERFLRVSGYDWFPFLVATWHEGGSDAYGRGPGHSALPDVKMLQGCEKELMISVQLANRPPVMTSPTLKGGRVNLLPGGVNHGDAGGSGQRAPVEPVMSFMPQTKDLEARIARLEQAIHETFFRQLFLMTEEGPDQTATWVLERKQEKMILLGPVITRNIHDVLEPLIDIAYDVAQGWGLIPPVPRELDGIPLDVEFVSMLAQAQRLVATQGIDSMTQFVGALAAAVPAVLDKVDWDQAVDERAQAVGCPPAMIRADEVVAGLRQQRAQQQAQVAQREEQARAAALAEQAANTGKALAETPTPEGGNALANLARAVEGGALNA